MMKEETRQQIQKAEVSISDFTELIREADRLFETVGGSTRHYVSDCLLPLMEEKGMKLISTAGAEWMAGEADRLREWIPVSKRLPEEGGRYWCYVEELTDLGWAHYQWNIYFDPMTKLFHSDGDRVTHWMELPNPPQTENNG